MLKTVRKFSRYAVVGIIGTFTHLGILAFLVEILHHTPIISSTIGFLVTVIISYYLNYNWTFRSKGKHLVVLTRYITVSLIGLCLNTGIMHLVVHVFSLWYGFGQMISIILIPLSNFFLNSKWAFKI
jgi:putative flippase GtrA